MDFKRTGPNAVEITTSDGVRILFSYGEPVAIRFPLTIPWPRDTRLGSMRTDRYVSRTTERHISDFLDDAPSNRVPHAEILRATKEAR